MSKPADVLHRLVRSESTRERSRFLVAGASAAAVAGASVLLLGVSGWFITGAAWAGTGGLAAASAFNYLLPSACIRLLAILRTGCRYSERLVGHDAALRTMARIRPALFRGLAALPPDQAMALSAGDAVARMVQDVDQIEAHLVRRSAPWGAWAAWGSGVALLLMAGVPAAAAATALLGGLLLAGRWLCSRLDARGRAVPAANGRLKQDMAALLAAAPELRAYGLEDWAAGRIAGQAQALVVAQQRATAAGGWFELMQASAAGLAAAMTLVLAHAAPLPVVAMAVLGAVMMIDGASGVLRSFQRQGSLRAAEDRLAGMLGRIGPAVTPDQSPPVAISLRDFEVELAPGAVAGILGPSGCGKTTLIEGLLRLRAVDRGCILLGGIDINDLDPAFVRGCFSVAPQDAALLSGTVRENLLLASPAASEAALWDALHDAALDDRVRALPEGLDTWIGENGARLSGGERRRLSVARAFMRAAPWLLLDEPTEGLDAGAEAVVVARLTARLARRGQGALIVSHRAAPIAECRIIGFPGSQRPFDLDQIPPPPSGLAFHLEGDQNASI